MTLFTYQQAYANSCALRTAQEDAEKPASCCCCEADAEADDCNMDAKDDSRQIEECKTAGHDMGCACDLELSSDEQPALHDTNKQQQVFSMTLPVYSIPETSTGQKPLLPVFNCSDSSPPVYLTNASFLL